jgi:hypothetical protein
MTKDEAQKTLSDELKMKFIDEQENSYLSRHDSKRDSGSRAPDSESYKSRDSSLKIIDFASSKDYDPDKSRTRENFSLIRNFTSSISTALPNSFSNEVTCLSGIPQGTIKVK